MGTGGTPTSDNIPETTEKLGCLTDNIPETTEKIGCPTDNIFLMDMIKKSVVGYIVGWTPQKKR
jgi:hypothetical protein